MNHTAHYISGTHWDREWYRPLQEFRFLLVQLLDELLVLMERNPEFRYFQLDGQTCVLEDYLEIRPANRERLAKLIRDGRILIGPWFTMPDLFCVGDEALIRNLLLGRRIAREWGVKPMPVGFICDMFGHPSQMPQLFAGFGLRDVVLGRGTNEHTTPMFFNWESPDGTQAFTFKLQDSQGYGAFALPRATLETETFVTMYLKEFVVEMEAAKGEPARERAVREKHFRHELAKYVNHEISRANGTTLCLMDSMDHTLPATDVGRYLRLIREACPTVTPHHSTLPAFFQEARRTARDLPVKRGELREPSKNRNGYLWLIPFCPSARVRLKQANDDCQNLLEKWVEPLLAVAENSGPAAPAWRGFLNAAWKQVLTNHAHDSICGCSIDQVHRDMQYRFDQARGLGEQLRAQLLGRLTAGCADLARAKDEFTLTLVNPLPHAREEVVVFDVDLPPEYPATFSDGFFTQRIQAFTLETADGQPVPYQRLGFVPGAYERSRFAKYSFQHDGEFTRHTVAARLSLPALGFTSVRVKPSATPVRALGSLRIGPTAAANEHLAIAIESNGTLTVTDKATGETYTGWLTFEDVSETGDGWFHARSVNDEAILSAASAAQVAVAHDGPELVAFRVTVRLRVPAQYDAWQEKPSERETELRISSVITLRRGARVVDVETTVDNTAEDHRLRVLFPTDATAAQTYLAHHPYDLTERRIALDPQTASWQEREQQEKPFLGLQAVGHGARGLAFISAGGLHEGGVIDDQRRTMTVTLLRSFRKTIGDTRGRDGLEPGRLHYRYALLPFAGDLPRTEALRALARLQAGLFTRQTGSRPSGFPALAGAAPATQEFLEAQSGRLVVAAVKSPEQGKGLVVRLWNPGDRKQTEQLKFWRVPKRARYVALSETPVKDRTPKLAGAVVSVEAGPHEIVTVRVEF